MGWIFGRGVTPAVSRVAWSVSHLDRLPKAGQVWREHVQQNPRGESDFQSILLAGLDVCGDTRVDPVVEN